MKIVHYSQQFHRSPAVLGKAVTDILNAVTEPDILTLTEVGTRDRASVLPREGFTVTQGSHGGRAADCAIITRDSVYTVIASEAWQVTDTPYRSLPGRLVKGWWVIAAILEDVDGKRVLVTAGHPLAHLVSKLRKRIHREGCIGWSQNIQSFADRYGVERVVIVADWNLNLRKASSVKYLEDIFGAGFKVAAPRKPTHDSRVIDGAVLLGFKSLWARTMPKTRASDHAPVSFFLEETDVPDPEPQPPSPPYVGPAKFFGSKTNKPINRLVIHATVSPCKPGAARATAEYFKHTVVRPSSAHYVTDPDESVQVVYDSWVAYHAPPNEHSLGFELTFNPTHVPIGQWLLPNQRKMIKRAARLVAEAAVYYDVPVVRLTPQDLRDGKRGICGHIDVSNAWGQTSHWDPGHFPWRGFMKKVDREVEAIKAGL